MIKGLLAGCMLALFVCCHPRISGGLRNRDLHRDIAVVTTSGTQFYIVQGRRFTDAGLDSLEQGRLKGRKIPPAQREVYKTEGGAPHLDQSYTVFGEVVRGLDVVDSIAAVPTTGRPFDRPLGPVRILKMRLIRRQDRSVK